MINLTRKLSEISDAYDDFVLAVLNYAKKKPDHVELLNEYMDSHPGATTSDIVRFISLQPDFHSYSACGQEQVG